MKNSLVITILRRTCQTGYPLTQGGTRGRGGIPMPLLAAISILLAITPAHAGLQQVLLDGQAGRFEQARSELQRLSDELRAQATSTDITVVGRNCAAIGFYSMLSQTASDCISKKLDPQYGKKLFTAAQNAASLQSDKAAALAKDVADSNPNYLPAQLLLGRIRMRSSMEHNQDCNEAIGMYHKALKMDKALAVAYLDLGMLYHHMGKNKEAIAILETASKEVQAHTATGWVHLMLALLYSKEEQWTQARRHAEIARDLGLTGLGAELVGEIQRHVKPDSTPGGQVASVEKRNEELFEALSNGNTEKAKALLDEGANVNATSKGRGTVLHGAALKGQSDLVELLVKRGAAVNAKDDKYGATPLHLAAYKGHRTVVQILLLAGADVHAKDKEGDTPLDNALSGGHRDVAELIKTLAGKSRPAVDEELNSEFRVAAGMGQMGRVQNLLKQGADVNSRAPSAGAVPAGGTALMLAAARNHLEMVKFLISHGAKVDQADQGGGTALIYGVWKGYKGVVAVLLENGADVHARTRDGRTPLSVAKQYGYTEIEEMLKAASKK